MQKDELMTGVSNRAVARSLRSPTRKEVAKPDSFGQPPKTVEFDVVDLWKLRIDYRYQRPKDLLWDNAIARNWDWTQFTPIHVSHRLDDGEMYLIDGQQRLEALKLRPEILQAPDAPKRISCVLHRCADYHEEAGLYVKLNKNRKKLTALHTYFGDLAAGDSDALACQRLLDKHGVDLNSNRIGHDVLRGIAGFRGWRRADEAALDVALEIICPVYVAAEPMHTRSVGAMWMLEHALNKREMTLKDRFYLPKLRRLTGALLNTITLVAAPAEIIQGEGSGTRIRHGAERLRIWINKQCATRNRIPPLFKMGEEEIE